MQQHANLQKKRINNTLNIYKNIPAYSTWFGVQMPIDFDFGAHCNIVYFVHKYHLPLTLQDSATIQLIQHQIKNKYHISKANYISPYYFTTPILLYHISRLLHAFSIPQLDSLKPQLIADAQAQLLKANCTLDSIVLATTLLKLHATTPININVEAILNNNNYQNTDFVFYTGHLFGHLQNAFKKTIANIAATKFNWYCNAFNTVILLEYAVLKRYYTSSSF
jgi:hypothetical protein